MTPSSEREHGKTFRLSKTDLHPHLRARMGQRGVTVEEVEQTLTDGWQAADAKPGTLGRMKVFPYAAEWEGEFYLEKQVIVYYKQTSEGIIV